MLNFIRGLLLFGLCSCGLAQSQTSAPSTSNKSGQEVCDGALDIVPTKAATFMRKRRANTKKPVAKPEMKTNHKAVR